MAAAHPGRDSFIKYLKTNFPWKENWEPIIKGEEHSFTHKDVKRALKSLQVTDPKLYRLLSYRWQTARNRSDLAGSLYLDPSTLKRHWDVATNIVVNYLINEEVTSKLDSVDIGYE